MVSRAAIDFSSSWFDWFVRNRPTSGMYLKGGADGTISWAAGGGTTAIDNVVFASDYATLDLALAASVDVEKTLVLNKSFTVAATRAITTDNATIIGTGRGYNATYGHAVITASQAITEGVLDIRADGVTLQGFTIDCASKAGTVGIQVGNVSDTTANSTRCGLIRDVEVLNAPASGMRFGDDVDYWMIDRCRLMTGHYYAVHFDPGANSAYDNGHVYFQGCEMSGTEGSVAYTAAGSGYHRGWFIGCHFNDGHSGTWMVQMPSEWAIFGCDFEINPAGMPSSGILAMDRYGQSCSSSWFSCGNLAGSVIVGSTSYDPYITWGNTMNNGNNAATIGYDGTGARFIGQESTIFTNWAAGTKFDGTIGTINYYSQAAQPTLTFNGEIAIWHDTDDNKIYLVARGNAGDKAHELP